MKIDPNIIESIKRLHLPTLIQEHGIQLHKNGGWFNRNGRSYKINCPFHEDKNPSCHINEKHGKWIWHCFGCNEGGNVFDFLQKINRTDFRGVYEKYAPRVGAVSAEPAVHPDLPVPPSKPLELPTEPLDVPAPETALPLTQPLLEKVINHYHETLINDKRGLEYLTHRGLADADAIKTFKIGFANGNLNRLIPRYNNHETNRALKEAGILNEKLTERYYNSITIPIYDQNNAIVGLYGRKIYNPANPSIPVHLYMPGQHKGVFNWQAVKAHKEIILTECIIDALSLYVMGIKNVVPLYGVHGLTDEHKRLFTDNRTQNICLCFDNDKAGTQARQRIKQDLEPLGITIKNIYITAKHKDINDALRAGDITKEKIQNEINRNSIEIHGRSHATLLASAVGNSLSKEQQTNSRPPSDEKTSGKNTPWPKVDQEEDAIFISFPERQYRIKGLNTKNLESMRVNVRVTQRDADGIRRGDGAENHHLDIFDLYSAKSRAIFNSHTRKIISLGRPPGTMSSDIEGDIAKELNQIIEELEQIQAQTTDQRPQAADQKPTMTDEEKTEALETLKHPALMQIILKDIDQIGYVGEDHNKKIGYLIATSRKQDDPLSCSILSQSAAGKSVLADTIEKFIPPEDVLVLSRTTKNAFYYMAKDGLKNKLVIMEERIGGEEADYSIRTLQSKKKLIQAVPVKDEKTGQIKTQIFTVEGPLAYIETTTQIRIHDENATRCFEINLDETKEQTQRIHKRQKQSKTAEALENDTQTQHIIHLHHNMQRLLEPVKVVIPYALLIDFPDHWLRTRRDNLRFLNLISSAAFLHQHQRQHKTTKDGAQYIEAALQDYETAYILARDIMGEGYNDLKKSQRDLLKTIEQINEHHHGVTRRQIREHTGLSDTRLRELLYNLVSLEYLNCLEGKQGKSYRYQLTGRAQDTDRQLIGLTSPERLNQKLTEQNPQKPDDNLAKV